MKSIITLLETKKGNYIVFFSITLLFILYAIIHLYPFNNTYNEDIVSIDDWGRYLRNAEDIRTNGILIPSIKEAYFAPAGFLYNYFIAVCISIFGQNTIPIFIIQNVLLGVSVCLIYFTFSKSMGNSARVLFLVLLISFALIDIGKYYTNRLLSEPFALFFIATFFFCFTKALNTGAKYLFTFSAVLLGMAVLCRPNLLPFAILACVFLVFQKIALKQKLFFCTAFLIAVSLLCVRNYFVCQQIVFMPTEGLLFSNEAFGTNFSFILILKKIAFCLGYLSWENPDYLIRPHWMLLWIFSISYCIYLIRHRKASSATEKLNLIYLVSFFGTLIIIAPQIGSYGFRLLCPAILFVIPFAVLTLDKLIFPKFLK